MEESKIINRNLIFLDEPKVDKEQIIKFFANKLKENHYIDDENTFYEAVMEREYEIPTAIGYDIAIPHGKSNTVLQPFIAFLRTQNKFKWTEGYEDDVQLIFQIGVPDKGNEKLHLKFISEVSKKLLDEHFREKLKTFSDVEQIYELLNSIEI